MLLHYRSFYLTDIDRTSILPANEPHREFMNLISEDSAIEAKALAALAFRNGLIEIFIPANRVRSVRASLDIAGLPMRKCMES
jgi:hypothetical protein